MDERASVEVVVGLPPGAPGEIDLTSVVVARPTSRWVQ